MKLFALAIAPRLCEADSMSSPDQCPACGAEVPRGAKACPECGSDERTGWSQKARYDDLGIADDEDFDYNEFVEREFKDRKPKRKGQTLWVVVAIILVLIFLRVVFAWAL